MLPLHGIGVGDSLLLVALVHKRADAWVTSLRVLTDDEIMSMDANRVVCELQDEVARELNSHLSVRLRPSGQVRALLGLRATSPYGYRGAGK